MHVPHEALQSTAALLHKGQRVKDRVRPVRHARSTRITPRVRALVPLGLTTDNLRQVELEIGNARELLAELRRFEEAKSLMRKSIPIARRVSGGNHDFTLRMRNNYARALYLDDSATLDHLREAVTTFEDLARIARRVLGGAHPFTGCIDANLGDAREALARAESA